MRTILFLTISNIFMTFAWYGHLYRGEALWKVVLVSWGIAFFEYCFQVPANCFGSYELSKAQLKTIVGSHYAKRVRSFLRNLPWRKDSLELRRRIRLHLLRRLFHLP